jgi:hypothetical protein
LVQLRRAATGCEVLRHVAPPVVARIMIEVRRGQNNAGLPDLYRFHEIGRRAGRPRPLRQV